MERGTLGRAEADLHCFLSRSKDCHECYLQRQVQESSGRLVCKSHSPVSTLIFTWNSLCAQMSPILKTPVNLD